MSSLSALTESAEVRKGTIGGERQLLNPGQGAAQEPGAIRWRLAVLRQFLRVSQRIRKAIQRNLKSDGATRLSERAETESELVDSEGDPKRVKGPPYFLPQPKLYLLRLQRLWVEETSSQHRQVA